MQSDGTKKLLAMELSLPATRNNPEQSIIYLKQFVFLSSNSLSKEMIDKTIRSGKTEKSFMAGKNFTDNSYTTKFRTWYHSSTFLKPFAP
jgi:hypothetical protein